MKLSTTEAGVDFHVEDHSKRKEKANQFGLPGEKTQAPLGKKSSSQKEKAKLTFRFPQLTG